MTPFKCDAVLAAELQHVRGCAQRDVHHVFLYVLLSVPLVDGVIRGSVLREHLLADREAVSHVRRQRLHVAQAGHGYTDLKACESDIPSKRVRNGPDAPNGQMIG